MFFSFKCVYHIGKNPGPAALNSAGAAPELERARQRAKRAAQRPKRSHLEQLLDQESGSGRFVWTYIEGISRFLYAHMCL